MDLNRLQNNFSQKILIQLFVVSAFVIITSLYFSDFLVTFYTENQKTNTGLYINLGIFLLFIIGLINVLLNLLHYSNEEKSLTHFVENIEALKKDPSEGVEDTSLISKRYATLRSINSVGGEIDHGALSAMLTADEGTRLGFSRFINSILILTGVFGTIVSLSIALLGASHLIDSAGADLGGMGLVIHGMSTALSTTISAIVSYVVFGYFYLRQLDAQTHLLSGIEQLTSIHLIPKFHKKPVQKEPRVEKVEKIDEKMEGLIIALLNSSEKMAETQDTYHSTAIKLNKIVTMQQDQMEHFSDDIKEIKQLLKDGFRLGE